MAHPARPQETLGVAVVGFGWMGRVHTQAYARVRHHYPHLAVRPELVVVAEEVPGRGEEAAARFGFGSAVRDWREVAADPRVAAVSVTAPNFLHREIGVAMAGAGKHLWIEKPVGLTAEDARAVAGAVAGAGVQGAVGFNYRSAPAVEAARDLIAAGDIGTVTHVRVRLFSDYAAHPDSALTWRYERERGGSGVLGDLASHGADLARFLCGDIAAVTADTAVFLPERPRPADATAGHTRAAGGVPGRVENEDYVGCLLRFASGARGVLEACRVSVGEQNAYGFEVHGTKGAVFWDFRRMNELGVSRGTAYQDQPVSTVYVGPGDGEFAAFQPGAANAMGYDDLKVVEAYRFLRSIAEGVPHGATLTDAVRSAAVLDAMARSARGGTWTDVQP
ncbi:Gfo/Idh/MocA family protein [Streptomyces daghestanicus]|jgi:predicted dehydrogenase|uniref:Oxidoreductase n=1 Tax=Streptomyces daghestanicus TaxID=66885 RepID=A0ABQ3Q759_9ACTN|nr:Gfo/Idh/MocA family oxidoreductase [Streptomyces daghestanicus]GGU29727.1 oxidoreductase [Streptomyces daghestanicus]GHI33111.1 oxidoreductase [Streptomyces daghestanicus]